MWKHEFAPILVKDPPPTCVASWSGNTDLQLTSSTCHNPEKEIYYGAIRGQGTLPVSLRLCPRHFPQLFIHFKHVVTLFFFFLNGKLSSNAPWTYGGMHMLWSQSITHVQRLLCRNFTTECPLQKKHWCPPAHFEGILSAWIVIFTALALQF